MYNILVRDLLGPFRMTDAYSWLLLVSLYTCTSKVRAFLYIVFGCLFLACLRCERRSHSTHVLVLVASLAVGCSSMLLTRFAIRKQKLLLNLAFVLEEFWDMFCRLVHRAGFSGCCGLVRAEAG